MATSSIRRRASGCTSSIRRRSSSTSFATARTMSDASAHFMKEAYDLPEAPVEEVKTCIASMLEEELVTGSDPVVIRSLTREYRVFSATTSLRGCFASLRRRRRSEGAPLQSRPIRCRARRPFYRVRLPTGGILEGERPAAARAPATARSCGGCSDEAPDGVLLHGAASSPADRRVSFSLGEKASGKTTLALRLLAEAFAVEGDEHVDPRDTTSSPGRAGCG